jgi:PKD repeat protein
MVISEDVNAEFNEEWVAKYNSPDNYHDFVYSMIVGPSGNVYVTGGSLSKSETGGAKDHNYTTVMYDAYGNEQWVANYNGPGGFSDNPYDIALDSSENVYVTGRSIGIGTEDDCATLKYDPDGNEIWCRRYDGGNHDIATAIAVDSQDYIYITGYNQNGYLTIKYDQNGTQQWIRSYSGGDDRALDIEVDEKSKNVYVTGYSNGDIATVAYDSHGNFLWARRQGSCNYYSSRVRYIALDPDGNVYVMGTTKSPTTSNDYTIIKYNSTGYKIWARTYNSPGNGQDNAYGIDVDSSGNVFVTGRSYYPSLHYRVFTTVKYDKNGNRKWVTNHEYGSGRGIRVDDSSGSIYVIGTASNGSYATMTTISYDQDGNQQWVKYYNGFGDEDRGIFVDVDPFGNVFVSGYTEGNGSYTDFCTIKYSQENENQPPIADAGPDQTIGENRFVHFDGTGSYDPDGTIDSYEWDFDANVDSDGDGNCTNDVDSEDPRPFYSYGDNGVFVATLTVTSSGEEGEENQTDQDTVTITVYNRAPILEITIPSIGYVGVNVDFSFEFFEPGSDDTFHFWDYGDGNTSGLFVHYNNGHSPDPYPSPDIHPKTSTGTARRHYHKAGIYTVTFTVWDDDNGTSQKSSQIQIFDNFFCDFSWSPEPQDEGYQVQFTDISNFGIFDTISRAWDFAGLGSSSKQNPQFIFMDDGIYPVTLTITNDAGTHSSNHNVTIMDLAPTADFSWSPDPQLENSIIQFTDLSTSYPDEIVDWHWDFGDGGTSSQRNVTHTYGDDGVYPVTLTVVDDDNSTDSITYNVSVKNVDPTVNIESAYMDVEIGLRVAGRKFNDVGMTLSENEKIVGYVSIERLPGSPDEQMAWIPMILDLTKTYSATVTYTPENPPNIGGNPVWIYIKFPNGSIQKIHHTFNVQQSKKRDSDHWNHVEPWEVDLNAYLMGWEFEVDYHITDPGSDDEILTFSYGSQTKVVTHLCNPPDPDPYPSPEINPRDIYGTATLIFEGPGIILLNVKDDDGGSGSATLII